MPKNVTNSRFKEQLPIAIATTVLCLIPVVIIAFVSIGNHDVWMAPYPRFVLYYLIINSFFALIMGMVAPLHKAVWIVLECLTTAATLGLVVWSYIAADALFIHVATANFFTYLIYLKSSDASDNFFLRYSIPLACLLVPLITVLWFIGAGYGMLVHYIVSGILNGIFFLVALFGLIHVFREGLDEVASKTVSYTEQTEEEIREAKEQKAYEKQVRAEEKARKKQQSMLAKAEHDSDPDVIAKREKAQERSKKVGKVFLTIGKGAVSVVGGVFGFAFSLLPGTAPFGSKKWSIASWAEYIEEKMREKGADVSTYDFGSGDNAYIKVNAFTDVIYTGKGQSYDRKIVLSNHGEVISLFKKVTSHCPYKVKLLVDGTQYF